MSVPPPLTPPCGAAGAVSVFTLHNRHYAMKLPLLSLIALAPLLLHAGASCCGDVSAFADKPAATAAAGDTPRIALTETQRANLALRVDPVAARRIAVTAFALGEFITDPRGESAVSSRIAGRLVELKVAVGDTVKAGDTVAVVESRQPGDTPVRIALTAPASGTVDELAVRLGDPVSPDAALMRLSDHTRLVAIARIPQTHVAALKPAATLARVTPEGGAETTLTLESLNPRADALAGTVLARFKADNPAGAFTPGQRAAFRVILSESEHSHTIPREAVQGERGDLFVFVENATGVYEKRPVVVAEGDERFVPVRGVKVGDRVVTHGAYALRYAGASSGTLKAALEAAHGHAHGPNGEELGANAAPAESHPAGAHTHADGTVHNAAPAPKLPAGAHVHADGSVHVGDHAAPAPDDGLPDEDDLNFDPLRPMEEHADDDGHDHAGHDHEEGEAAADPHAGHNHAPGEHGKTAAPAPAVATKPFFTGSSGEVLLGTLAAGETLLLALALNTLRRRRDKEVSDA